MNLLSAALQSMLAVGIASIATGMLTRLTMWIFRIPTEDVRDGLDGGTDWTGMTYGWRALWPGVWLVGTSIPLLALFNLLGVI